MPSPADIPANLIGYRNLQPFTAWLHASGLPAHNRKQLAAYWTALSRTTLTRFEWFQIMGPEPYNPTQPDPLPMPQDLLGADNFTHFLLWLYSQDIPEEELDRYVYQWATLSQVTLTAQHWAQVNPPQ